MPAMGYSVNQYQQFPGEHALQLDMASDGKASKESQQSRSDDNKSNKSVSESKQQGYSRFAPILTFIASTLPRKDKSQVNSSKDKLQNGKNKSTSQTSLDVMVRPLKSILKCLHGPSDSPQSKFIRKSEKQVHFASNPKVYEYELDSTDGNNNKQLRRVSSLRRKRSKSPERIIKSNDQVHKESDRFSALLPNNQPSYDIVTGVVYIPIHSQQKDGKSITTLDQSKDGYHGSHNGAPVYHNQQEIQSMQHTPVYKSHQDIPYGHTSHYSEDPSRYQHHTDTLQRRKNKAIPLPQGNTHQYSQTQYQKHSPKVIYPEVHRSTATSSPEGLHRQILLPVSSAQYQMNKALRYLDHMRNGSTPSMQLHSNGNERSENVPKLKLIFLDSRAS